MTQLNTLVFSNVRKVSLPTLPISVVTIVTRTAENGRCYQFLLLYQLNYLYKLWTLK